MTSDMGIVRVQMQDANGHIPRDDAHEPLKVSFISVRLAMPIEHEMDRRSRQGWGFESFEEEFDFFGDGRSEDSLLQDKDRQLYDYMRYN
jgi:hypothetical protein